MSEIENLVRPNSSRSDFSHARVGAVPLFVSPVATMSAYRKQDAMTELAAFSSVDRSGADMFAIVSTATTVVFPRDFVASGKMIDNGFNPSGQGRKPRPG